MGENIGKRVFVVDGDFALAQITKDRLEAAGNEVVGVATDLDAALMGVARAKELGIEVVTVGEKLGPGLPGCSDGQRVTGDSNLFAPEVVVVAFTYAEEDGGLPRRRRFGDHFVEKDGSQRSFDNLVKAVSATQARNRR
jgi:hypothetical protein